MNYPGIKTLEAVTDSPEQLRALITGEATHKQFAEISPFILKCLDIRTTGSLVMRVANSLINGRGVRPLNCHGDYHAGDLHAEYIDTGGPDTMTLIREHDGRFIVTTLDNYFERIERIRVKHGGCCLI